MGECTVVESLGCKTAKQDKEEVDDDVGDYSASAHSKYDDNENVNRENNTTNDTNDVIGKTINKSPDDEEKEDNNDSPLPPEPVLPPSSSLYDLYGIVHHLGALHGGHYVASLRSEADDKWRLYNDAQISEISKKDIIDASAYI